MRQKELEGKGTFAQAKQTEQLLQFEKERAKWEQEKSYIQNQKDDAVEAQQRMEKKVEILLRENEKLKNDLRANRKNVYAGGAGGVQPTGMPPTNFQAAMQGKAAYERLGGGVNKSTVLGAGFASHLLKNDGSGTDRSTTNYQMLYNPLGKEEKTFTSPSQGAAHGAVSALNLAGAGLTTPHQQQLDSSYLKHNILNTPSSGKSKSEYSQEDDMQKHQ